PTPPPPTTIVVPATTTTVASAFNQPQQQQQQQHAWADAAYTPYSEDFDHDTKRAKKSNTSNTIATTTTATPRRQSNPQHGASSGRPSRVKGPCQSCQEASDGCMRKAFHWPFPSSQIFNDKGKPFVYLCNKCGLR